MISQQTRVAVLFHRVGPYHFARLRVAGRLLSIVAIESSGVDEIYEWDAVAGADHFERVTLFDRVDAQKLPATEVACRVGSALDKVHPTVVAVPGWADSAALGALRWCVQNHVPAIMMSDSTAWDYRRVPWKEWVKTRVVRMCSAGLVAGTPHKDYMVKLGMPAERVFLGYDAVENEYFSRKAEEVRGQKSEFSNKYGLPEKYFLASARFVEKKNLPRLLQAYALYRQKAESGTKKVENTSPQPNDSLAPAPSAPSGPSPSANSFRRFPSDSSPQRGEGNDPWDLVLLGDGPLRSTLNSQLSTLNLHGHVQMPGFKQYHELPVYYGLASAFVHASTTEQWGLVVNEAMASGLPVLVSNRCGCATDLVKDGVNGFTFDPYDVEQMAELMARISGLGSGLSEFGAASARIISQWGPERFGSGLKSAVENAMEARPKRAGIVDRFLLRALLAR
jgi:1,2-diacylglycerol 3-alpha-glucosyltransferase